MQIYIEIRIKIALSKIQNIGRHSNIKTVFKIGNILYSIFTKSNLQRIHKIKIIAFTVYEANFILNNVQDDQKSA